MLTPEQRARIEELESHGEKITPADQKELERLLAIPDDSDAEFDAAWNETDDEGQAVETEEEEQSETSEQVDADADSGDDALNHIPNEADSSDNDGSDAPDPRDAEIARLRAEQEAQAQKMRSWEGRLKAADRRAAEAEAKLEADTSKGQTKSDDGSLDDDDPELSDFFNEFPDLQAPMTKVAQKMAEKIINQKLSKVEEIEQQFSSVQDTLKEDANEKHRATIEEAHPDYLEIYKSGALESWIQRQPNYLQPRLHEIISSGSAREIVEMYDSYKGIAGKKPQTKTDISSLSEEKRKRAKAMQAVPAQTGGPKKPKTMPAKDDFDGAWDHFNKDEKR
jgi:archaellum component FlaC